MSTKERSSDSIQQPERGCEPEEVLEERGTTTVEELKDHLEPDCSVEIEGTVWKNQASDYEIDSDADYVLAPECVSYDQDGRYLLRGEPIEDVRGPLRAYRNGKAFVVFGQK